jgi:hypothetical protein
MASPVHLYPVRKWLCYQLDLTLILDAVVEQHRRVKLGQQAMVHSSAGPLH